MFQFEVLPGKAINFKTPWPDLTKIYQLEETSVPDQFNWFLNEKIGSLFVINNQIN